MTSVLTVNSAMGKSRSATVCIAYLLNRQPSALTPESALDIIRQNRPLCEPNPGFMEQLSVYHQMGCPDDVTSHPLYSRWLYRREVEESVACGRAPEMKSVLFEDEQPRQSQEPAGRMTEIKCRKCRLVLITILSKLIYELLLTTSPGANWRPRNSSYPIPLKRTPEPPRLIALMSSCTH